MKWLFSILLIANLAMFIWVFPQQDGAPSGDRPEDFGQLRLVGEQQEAASEISAEDASKIQPPTIVLETEMRVSPAEIEPVIPVTTESVAPVTTEPVAPPELTSKPIAEEEAVAEAAAPPVTPASPEPPDEPMCGRVGMFDKRSQAELLSVRLLAQGGKTDIISESSNEQAGFWVLIPAQPNRAAAIKIAKRLESAGVADIWRFTSGKLAHAISLGLFRNRARAQARRNEIANLGFKPEVRPRYREQTRYWLNYRYTGDTPLTETRWQELKQQHPELERVEEACN
jgi:cell division protein FtsN